MPSPLLLLLALARPATAAEWLQVSAHRPPASSWSRSRCGSPSGAHPASAPGPLQHDTDRPGNDMAPCGPHGCVLPPNATLLSCEAKCNATRGCAAYVFAAATCSGKAGPVCFVKSQAGTAQSGASCRDSRVVGGPASLGADIPSRWAADVSAQKTPLPAHPRPQLVRGSGPISALRERGDACERGGGSAWQNLNGLWEWEPAGGAARPPFGRPLSSSILVPFPVESCLSGVAPSSSAAIVKEMWYRLTFDAARGSSDGAAGRTLLHFGAADWQAAAYLNGVWLGNHTGGYDGFSFDVTAPLRPSGNELLLHVYDPSDSGAQPNGKQRISAIDHPGGDTYTPSSGIWQTVWLEAVPATYISNLTINQHSLTAVEVSAALGGGAVGGAAASVTFEVLDASGKAVATAHGGAGETVRIAVPSPRLWRPGSPHLYDLRATLDSGDSATGYFGLRTFELGDGPKGKRPLLNGNFTFLAGFLDQSWWPDGQYTAPTDAALAYDIEVLDMFGLNMIRLHQKVNPERWYYHADRLGVVVLQDMVQKYGHATAATVPLFVDDFKAMVRGRGNHPCIVQWETFNEADCWKVFNTPPYDVAGIVRLARSLDPHRLVDTDSGGGANDMHIGDVNDVHDYPQPGDPRPYPEQYAMVGEFGGIGAFVDGKEWKPHACSTYLPAATPDDEKDDYVAMAAALASRVENVSASVYTQTTDVERECDGFLNYDRSNKFSDAATAAIKKANRAIIEASSRSSSSARSPLEAGRRAAS